MRGAVLVSAVYGNFIGVSLSVEPILGWNSVLFLPSIPDQEY